MRRTFAIAAAILVLVSLTAGAYAAGAAGAHKEHYPRIHKALQALNGAITELKAAPHDFGGHRVDAVAACEKAVDQLKQALAYEAGSDARKTTGKR